MKLSVCIASRGHPKDLLTVIKSIDDNAYDPEKTTIAVALDDNDSTNPEPPKTRCNLLWSVDPQEDSLGAKYNRAQMISPQDTEFYVLGADDNIFSTKNWDDIIRAHANLYDGQAGLVYFGRLDGSLPTQMAISHHFVKVQGWLFPPYWPFWFHDTWIDEIGHMTNRILWAPIPIQEIGGRGKTRGLREVTFWAEFFETLRPMRELIACEISEKFNPPWLDAILKQKTEIFRKYFASRTYNLRDPATAVSFERRMSVDAGPSERYNRIKSAAEQMLAEIRQEKAA